MRRLAMSWARTGIKIGFVPTMGYLHAGHLSLIRRARSAVGAHGKVVVSIYVNPTQFGPGEDFSRYPRDLKQDVKLCRAAGADVIFAPRDEEMYPRQAGAIFSTYVVEETLSRGMEGDSRPTHFRGVTTIVAKLFNIVQPQIAVFGAKDYQQAAIVGRMVQDLNFPVKILVAPTHREADGLAMSSRNKYLKGDLRNQAVVLWRALEMTRTAMRQGAKPIPAIRLKARLKKLIETEPAARLDYVEFFEPDTLKSVSKVTRGTHMALAVFVGRTRLIDNARL
jgi:pantoate--beta-alanine ligase